MVFKGGTNIYKKPSDENFNLLAKSVVAQGVDDYKTALKQKWALENRLHAANCTIAECEAFFYSEWCKELSDIDDPSYIRNNSFIEAKKEFNKQENVTVRIDITPKKKKTKVAE